MSKKYKVKKIGNMKILFAKDGSGRIEYVKDVPETGNSALVAKTFLNDAENMGSTQGMSPYEIALLEAYLQDEALKQKYPRTAKKIQSNVTLEGFGQSLNQAISSVKNDGDTR